MRELLGLLRAELGAYIDETLVLMSVALADAGVVFGIARGLLGAQRVPGVVVAALGAFLFLFPAESRCVAAAGAAVGCDAAVV